QGSAGIVKADGGKLTLNSPAYYTGETVVNGGTLVLNGGANTIMVTPTATVPTVNSDLRMNGGTLDLNGNDQAVGFISTVAGTTIPTAGVVITNNGASAAN